MSPDPSGLVFADQNNPNSLNLYAYALNNPLRLIDPSGLFYCQNTDKDGSSKDGGASSKHDCQTQGGTWITEPGDPQTIVNETGSAIIPEPLENVVVNGGSDDSLDVDDDSGSESFIDYLQLYDAKLSAAGCVINPLLGTPTRVSSGFGPRINPVTHEREFHPGLDLPASVGSPVYSTMTGIVNHAGPRGTMGNAVIVDTPFAGSSDYMHLNSWNVNAGQPVRVGDLLGYSGNTGRSTGPHLHYEQHTPGTINAGRYLNPQTRIAPCFF